ncbi:hypothetical protein ACFV8E_40325 [Streptomyces sp. NPDC059849]|uniref:hypothetical protein n=1 Tax=Streptomyces sp. NPDC059849 TaxID=3346969 RepID=UPI00364ABF4A
MTVYFDPVGGVLLVVAFVVGYFVYKHTRQAATGKGDVVGAISCGVMVLTALVLILGGSQPAPQTPAPAGGGAPLAPASPTPHP